jgi:hypothetical protein
MNRRYCKEVYEMSGPGPVARPQKEGVTDGPRGGGDEGQLTTPSLQAWIDGFGKKRADLVSPPDAPSAPRHLVR